MARSNMRTLDSFERQKLKASRRPTIWDVDDTDDYDVDLDDTETEETEEASDSEDENE